MSTALAAVSSRPLPAGGALSWVLVWAWVAAVVVLVPAPCRAGAGDLDPDFGVGGTVIEAFDPDEALASDLALQVDAKIVVVGRIFRPGFIFRSRFALARYFPDGTLDPGFGSGGLVTTAFGSNTQNDGLTVLIQPDGKIVAAGVSGRDFALARYEADGSLDPSFGAGGLVTTDLGGGTDWIAGLALQPDGKIVAAGLAGGGPGGFDGGVARYLPDGSLDLGFGTAGIVTMDIAGEFDTVEDVVVQPDGKIVVVLRTLTDATTANVDFALVRLLEGGSVDPSFGNGGVVVTDFAGARDFPVGLALQGDGKIVATGFSSVEPFGGAEDFDLALARYLPDGSLDPDFGDGGLVATDLGSAMDRGVDVAVMTDGRLVVVGDMNSPTGDSDFAVARYLPGGSLDVGFGEGGWVSTDLNGRWDVAQAGVVQTDDKIVVAGVSAVDPNILSSTDAVFLVARYEALDSFEDDLEDLEGLIDELVESGALTAGQGNALISKLEAAARQLAKDNPETAINQLEAFINQVEALISSGQLLPEEGEPLIELARFLIESLSG